MQLRAVRWTDNRWNQFLKLEEREGWNGQLSVEPKSNLRDTSQGGCDHHPEGPASEDSRGMVIFGSFWDAARSTCQIVKEPERMAVQGMATVVQRIMQCCIHTELFQSSSAKYKGWKNWGTDNRLTWSSYSVLQNSVLGSPELKFVFYSPKTEFCWRYLT